MRVLLYHCLPFSLAHGGQQIQIVRTLEALKSAGVEAEFLDWHRAGQEGDILHFFGRLPRPLLEHARLKGLKVVVADLLGAQGARPRSRLRVETIIRRVAESAARRAGGDVSWSTYRQADACIALTAWEAELLTRSFGVEGSKVHVVPNGVDDVFFETPPVPRQEWLLSVATIAPVKRVLELAQAAVHARTPIRFLGRAYSEEDPYARRFLEFVRQHQDLLRYDGGIEERTALAEAYREARGFVLLSHWESLSLAALEAAASECPLLLSDLPWARSVFDQCAAFCPPAASIARTAAHLRGFYEHAPETSLPPKPVRWEEVGLSLRGVYSRLGVSPGKTCANRV